MKNEQYGLVEGCLERNVFDKCVKFFGWIFITIIVVLIVSKCIASFLYVVEKKSQKYKQELYQSYTNVYKRTDIKFEDWTILCKGNLLPK